MTRNFFFFAHLMFFLGLTACVTSADPSKDVHLTWDEAVVQVPGITTVSKETRDAHMANVAKGQKFPTVIYMHGAGGFSPSAQDDINIALKANLAVIALNSYARERPSNPGSDLSSNCRSGSCWVIDRNIYNFRNAELRYALEQVKKLPWVDQDNLFGWGHSEGTYAMAAYPGAIFKARIITGGGCAWGFGAEEPTLAIISHDDPYVARHHLEHTLPSTCLEKSGHAANLTYVEVPGALHNAAQTELGLQAFTEFLHLHNTSVSLSQNPQLEKQYVARLIVGNTLKLKVVRGANMGRTQFVYYDPSGLVVKTRNKPSEYDYGRYEIHSDGSHCYKWESKQNWPCWLVVEEGKNIYLENTRNQYRAEIYVEEGDTRGLLTAGTNAKAKANSESSQ